MATGHFLNLPITYKSQKSNFKISKNYWNKKMRLNRFKCSKFLLFYKKIIFDFKICKNLQKRCTLLKNVKLAFFCNFFYLWHFVTPLIIPASIVPRVATANIEADIINMLPISSNLQVYSKQTCKTNLRNKVWDLILMW